MQNRPNRPARSRTSRSLPKPIDVSRLKTYPLQRRHSKVRVSDFAKVWKRGGSFKTFLDSLPDILAVRSLREIGRAIAHAHRRRRSVILGMGAHVIKVGLGPIIVHLMERGIVSAIAMNGAVIIHDFVLALMGHPSV